LSGRPARDVGAVGEQTEAARASALLADIRRKAAAGEGSGARSWHGGAERRRGRTGRRNAPRPDTCRAESRVRPARRALPAVGKLVANRNAATAARMHADLPGRTRFGSTAGRPVASPASGRPAGAARPRPHATTSPGCGRAAGSTRVAARRRVAARERKEARGKDRCAQMTDRERRPHSHRCHLSINRSRSARSDHSRRSRRYRARP
jgi:hypothetical protein